MATLTGLIPVTVGTFEAYHGGGGGGDTIGGGGGGGGLGTQSAGPYIYIIQDYIRIYCNSGDSHGEQNRTESGIAWLFTTATVLYL